VAHRMKGNSEVALRHFEEAAGLFKRLNKTAQEMEAITAAAETAWVARKVDESRRWVETGIDRANVFPDDAALTKLLSLGATIANLRGDYSKAREYLDQLDRLKPQRDEAAEPVTEGGTLTVAITSPFQSRHPVNTTLLEETEVFSNVFETLVITDDQGRLLPHLCERWESLNEGAMFLFVLRRDVTLHDGRKLTATECKTAMKNAIRS
jgi:tetratricopeptide (TPR) repeat protein